MEGFPERVRCKKLRGFNQAMKLSIKKEPQV
jgi:hypothetical protein